MTPQHRLPRHALPRHARPRRADGHRRPSRSPRLVALLTALTLGTVGAGVLLLPASPGFSAEYDGELTRETKRATHEVTTEQGRLSATLTFEGTPPVRGARPLSAAVTLRDDAGRIVSRRYGQSPVTLSAAVTAGSYALEVSTSWPLTQRDLSYTLTVEVEPDATQPTPGPTTGPTTGPTVPTEPTPSPTDPTTTVPPSSASPTTTPPTSGAPTTAPPTTTPPTTPPTTPAAGIEQAVCGTWVLYQVTDTADLRSVRTRIEDALALPGVVGLSVRFPWDAVDLTGNESTDPLLEEAADIADRAGKALSIRFMAGAHTPQRVFDAGASSYVLNGQRVPLPFDNATGSHQVFLDAYADYVAKLAAWSEDHDVRLLHLSWYGQDWAELNHGAEVREAPGYSERAWLDGHRDLIDVGARVASSRLAVELPLSGYGPLSGGQSAALADHIASASGGHPDRFFIQANGWDETQEWGSPSADVESDFDQIWAKPVSRGLQMIQPDGYDWDQVFDRLDATGASYGEVYLPSFWQVPGPSAAFRNNTVSRVNQLEAEIAAFSRRRCG